MALVWKDRVKETSTTTGTGTYTLAGSVSGFQSFAAIGNGNTCYYAAFDSATGDWEVGLGTYTSSGTTLARTSVIASSNSNAAVSWAAGTRQIWVDLPASIVNVFARTDQANTFGSAQTFSNVVTVNGTGTSTIAGPLDLSGASAGQVAFPASQNASAGANTLDDYEEGTFTPGFQTTGSTFSYNSRSGSYTKVGNLITFRLTVKLNTTGNTLAGNILNITGLPFTASTDGWAMPVIWSSSSSNYVTMVAGTSAGSANLFVYGATAASSGIAGIPLNANAALSATAGSQLYISGAYTT